jgi:hypothetical protein
MKTLRAVVEETGLWSTPESFLCFAFGFDFPPVSEPILEVSVGVQVDFEPFASGRVVLSEYHCDSNFGSARSLFQCHLALEFPRFEM